MEILSTVIIWSTGEVEDRLDGLKPDEKAACVIAERVLGARAQAWDVEGKQGAVDAMLTLPDGRRAAFEVTKLAAEGALQLDALHGPNFEWPVPGRWWWDIQVGSVRDLPDLRERYTRIISLCEQLGVERPEQLAYRQDVDDPDINWLEKSASSMWGHSQVPAIDGDRVRNVMVVPGGRGGGVDRSLTGLAGALTDVFADGHLARHLAKIGRAEADEKHLFVPVHLSALPFAVIDGLTFGSELPPDAPPLPPEVTHLWLAPSLSRRVLLWTGEQWQNHYPYDG